MKEVGIMVPRRNEKNHKFFKSVCLFLIPIITMILIVVSFYDSNKFLVLDVIPLLLLVWCVTLILSMIGDGINYLQKHTNIEAKKVIFYCFSLALFMWCCFIELFARSILLGGFHAS
ncbi:MAG: hypothetical protein RSA90_05570 [Lachnospiraceae bacterium]